MCLDSRLKLRYAASLNALADDSKPYVALPVPPFVCIICGDSYRTQKEADACRQNDGADTFSKQAAYRRRQINNAQTKGR